MELIEMINTIVNTHEFTDEELEAFRLIRDALTAQDERADDGELWKDKYFEIKRRYHERFFSEPVEEEKEIEVTEENENITVEELFEEEK